MISKAEKLARANFLQRKMTRYFVVLDVDRDGHIEAEDFDKVAKRLAEVRGLSGHSPQYDALHAQVMFEWQELADYCDDDTDQEISLDEWFAHREDIMNGIADETGIALDDNQLKQERGQRIMALMDNDGDGVVSEADFIGYFSGFHLPEDLARRTFARIDVSGSGQLTQANVSDLYHQFIHSIVPEEPGNWLFGPF